MKNNEIKTTVSRPQFRVFGRVSDEESREVWWVKEDIFRTRAEADSFASKARRETGRLHVVRGPGELKPKNGYMSSEVQTRELRARFDELSSEEKDAYVGR